MSQLHAYNKTFKVQPLVKYSSNALLTELTSTYHNKMIVLPLSR